MKNLKHFLLISFITTLGVVLNSCNQKVTETNLPGFVSIKDQKFYLNGKPFFPLAVNYKTELHTDGNTFWIAPYSGYYSDGKAPYFNKDSCRKDLNNDLQWIKELGYNTIRIVGAGEEQIENYSNGLISFFARDKENTNRTYILDEQSYKQYFSALETLFQLAENTGLKIIFLTKIHPNFKSTEEHFKRLAKHFSEYPSLMAYDLFNEPLYFDTLLRDKKDVFSMVKHWQELKNECAPNQLSTIGLTGVREVLEWDPNLLSVDFISFHPYNYENNQVMSEIYWYGKYVKVPWMIGETGVPADNDSVPYSEQTDFAKATLYQTVNCGGIGYSWWQFKDVKWFDFHQDYLGVVSQNGESELANKVKVKGVAKPLNDVIKSFNSVASVKDCIKPENYYNYSENKYFKLTGKIIDEQGKPIEGAIILAWNEDWVHSFHSVSKDDGSFEVYSKYPFFHWRLSATDFSMTGGDFKPDLNNKDKNGTIYYDLGEIKLTRLGLRIK